MSIAISAGEFTVQGNALRPSAWASATLAAVTLRQNGDQAEHPAALACCGSEPPGVTSKPASQGDGLPATVFMFELSMVRQTVWMSGARAWAKTSAPQRNHWI